MWYLATPYGGFGGGVPPGASARVERVSRLERLRSLTPMSVELPTCLHRDEPVRFDHAFVTPGGWVLTSSDPARTKSFCRSFRSARGDP